MRYCKLLSFFCLIFFSICSVQVFAQVYIDSPPDNVFSIPIRLDKIVKIEGVDIIIKTNPAEIILSSASLVGGILESGDILPDYQISFNQLENGTIIIAIRASGSNIVADKGIIAFLNLSFISNTTNTTVITIDKFICNTTNCMDEAGFVLGHSIVHHLKIVDNTICNISNNNRLGIEEVIYALQIQAGLQEKTDQCINGLSDIIHILQILTGIDSNSDYTRKQHIQRIKKESKKKTIPLIRNNKLSIPIVINEKKEIEAIECIIEYNESFLEILDVTLKGGILENNNYILFYNDKIKRIIKLWIYASQNLQFQKGKIAFIEFAFTKRSCEPLDISLVSLNCNNEQIDGGFLVEDLTYKVINIISESCPYLITASSGDFFSLPISLSESHNNIEGLDIDLTFDEKAIDAKKVTLNENFVEANYLIESNLNKDNIISNVIYAINDTITASGDVFFVQFETIGKKCSTLLSFSEFLCNGTHALGGFHINGELYQTIQVIVDDCHYTITSTAGDHGSILPTGVIPIQEAEYISFEIIPDEGYVIDNVLIDSIPHGGMDIHNISNVTGDHSIHAVFKPVPPIVLNKPIVDIVVNEDHSDIHIPLNDIFSMNLKNVMIEMASSSSNLSLVQDKIIKNELILSFQKDQYGTAKIQLTGTARGKHASDQFNIWVKPVNDPAVIQQIEDQYIDINASTYPIDLKISDVDTPIRNLRIKAHSSNDRLLPNDKEHIIFQGIMNNRFIKLKPAIGETGDSTITVSVSDGNDTSSIQFLLNVQNVEYTITADVGNHGVINQSEKLIVSKGKSIKYRFFPDSGYAINDLIVDGQSMGQLSVYEFKSISDNHTLSISFKLAEKYIISSSAGIGGNIVPEGIININENKTKIFKITPQTGFILQDVIIDNQSIGRVYHYAFKNIQQNHTIHANFQSIASPDANFSSQSNNQTAPANVQFNDESQNSITSWYWDFGDGFNSSLQHPKHTYHSPGSYTIVLNVTGPGGTDTMVQPNHIQVDSTLLDFKADIRSGSAPLTVSFSDISKGCTITEWQFGDGYTQTGQHTTHVYAEPGKYTVTAKMLTENLNNIQTKSNYIIVSGRTISGMVVSENSMDVIENCLIEAWEDNTLINQTTTDVNGKYTLVNLPASDHLVISVWPPIEDKEYKHQFYQNHKSRQNADVISTKFSNQNDINFTLYQKAGYSIQGRVMNHFYQPMMNIPVSIYSKSTKVEDLTLTDENGNYTFTHLLNLSVYVVYAWSNKNHREYYYATSEGKNCSEYTLSPSDTALLKKNATRITPQEKSFCSIDIFINPNANIQGKVYLDNEPIKNIWVQAWSDTFQVGNSARTDINGDYTITGLMADSNMTPVTYNVEIVSKNVPYQAYQNESDLSNAQPVTAGSSGINFWLTSKATISGRIINDSGHPLEFVTIKAWSVEHPAIKKGHTLTNQNGYYTITNLLPAKDYIVAVYSTDYPVHFFKQELSQEDAQLINLTNNINLKNIDFILSKGTIVYGRIYLEKGDSTIIPASAGICVNIWSESSNTLKNAFTDDQGWYEIIGLNQDTQDYILSIKEENYMPSFYNQQAENNTVHALRNASRISPSDEPFEIILRSGYHINGKVVYHNAPVKDVHIELWSEQNNVFRNTITTVKLSDGANFLFTGITPGLYELKCISETYSDAIVVQNVENNVSDMIIELEIPELFISGTVKGLKKNQNATIHVFSQSIDIEKKIRVKGTGDDISYSLTHLKPSSDYVVSLYADDAPYQVYVYDGKYNQQAATQVDITTENFTHADFFLNNEEVFSVSGHIEFPESTIKGENAFIYVYSSEGIQNRTYVMYKGKQFEAYTITNLLPASDYIVVAGSETYGKQYYPNSLSIDNASLIDITTASKTNINFVFQSQTSISGTVYSFGNPVSNVIVSASSKKTGGFGAATTQSDGSYMIKGLFHADDYIINAKKLDTPTFYFSDTSTPVVDIVLAKYANTSFGDIYDIDIIIEQGQTIRGTVSLQNGRLLSDIKISAWSEIRQKGNIAYTKDDGSYIIEGLPEALDYQVSVVPDNTMIYIPQEKSNIATNSEGNNFILFEGFTINGIVEGSEDKILEAAQISIRTEKCQINKIIYSNYAGEFSLKGIPSGKDYEIMISSPNHLNYIPFIINHFIIDSNLTQNFKLLLASKISGYIYDNSGLPLPDISLTAFSSSQHFQKNTKSDEKGYYEFNQIPDAMDYVITAHPAGYVTSKQSNISAGNTVDFYLTHSGTISGSIITADGLPVINAFVHIHSESFDIEKTTLSDQEGKYELSGLKISQNGIPLSDYTLTVTHEGYVSQIKTNLKAFDQVNFIFSVNSISGTISDNLGNSPPDDVKIQIFLFKSMVNSLPHTVMANDEGNFSFSGLDEMQDYQLLFFAIGSHFSNPKQWAGDNDQGIDLNLRNNAKNYNTGGRVAFQFNNSWE
ncbi:secreted protein containing PKD domain protein [Candidatus Magnetomorum sp. HK-1]|nr:secreted protein containing PKD domain protein [Candidatus Magnetomorum sp. HK-1]